MIICDNKVKEINIFWNFILGFYMGIFDKVIILLVIFWIIFLSNCGLVVIGFFIFLVLFFVNFGYFLSIMENMLIDIFKDFYLILNL